MHIEVKRLSPDANLLIFTGEAPAAGTMIMTCRSKNDLPDLAEGLILECIDPFKLANDTRTTIAGLRFAAGADEFSVTASLGVAEREGELDTVEALVRRSDEALYAAKHAGRDRVVAWGR